MTKQQDRFVTKEENDQPLGWFPSSAHFQALALAGRGAILPLVETNNNKQSNTPHSSKLYSPIQYLESAVCSGPARGSGCKGGGALGGRSQTPPGLSCVISFQILCTYFVFNLVVSISNLRSGVISKWL